MRMICRPQLWGLPKGFCPHPKNCTCFNGLRSDLIPMDKEKALKIGRIEFKAAGATRKR